MGRSSAAPVQDRARLNERAVPAGLEGLAHDAVDRLGSEVAGRGGLECQRYV